MNEIYVIGLTGICLLLANQSITQYIKNKYWSFIIGFIAFSGFFVSIGLYLTDTLKFPLDRKLTAIICLGVGYILNEVNLKILEFKHNAKDIYHQID